METSNTVGIVLRAQDYKERERIITLFSPLGVLSMIVKGVSPKKTALFALTTPFSEGEYCFVKKNSDLYVFEDGTLLHPHLQVRSDWRALQRAGRLAQVILSSQWPGKGSEALFALYRAYHAHIGQAAAYEEAFLASFYLKMLKIEGLFAIEELPCGAEDKEVIAALIGVSQFSQLARIPVAESLLSYVETMSKQLLAY